MPVLRRTTTTLTLVDDGGQQFWDSGIILCVTLDLGILFRWTMELQPDDGVHGHGPVAQHGDAHVGSMSNCQRYVWPRRCRSERSPRDWNSPANVPAPIGIQLGYYSGDAVHNGSDNRGFDTNRGPDLGDRAARMCTVWNSPERKNRCCSRGHRGTKTFYMPNIAFNMVCGGEHVPGTKQDIQEMFFFAMKEKSIKDVFATGTKFFRQFEKNLVRDKLPTGTAKERGFVFPVRDNFEGLSRIKECAGQLGLGETDYAIGTDNAFSEIQKGEELRQKGLYDMRFSGLGIKTREELIEFNYSVVSSASNFVNMEDPGSESDVIAHKLMNEKYGDRVQIVIDDAAVTQLRYIIPFLGAKDRKDRAGNSVLIKLNQAGTFTETCLATEVVLGVADAGRVKRFLDARGDTALVRAELAKVDVPSLDEALDNIKAGGFSAFFSDR